MIDTSEEAREATISLLIQDAFPRGLSPKRLPADATNATHINSPVLVSTREGYYRGRIANIRGWKGQMYLHVQTHQRIRAFTCDENVRVWLLG